MAEIQKASNTYTIEEAELKMTAWKTSKGWKLDIFSKVVGVGAPTKSFKNIKDLIEYSGEFSELSHLEG